MIFISYIHSIVFVAQYIYKKKTFDAYQILISFIAIRKPLSLLITFTKKMFFVGDHIFISYIYFVGPNGHGTLAFGLLLSVSEKKKTTFTPIKQLYLQLFKKAVVRTICLLLLHANYLGHKRYAL